MNVLYQLELPQELHQRLNEIAEQHHRPVNSLLLEAVESYVDSEWDGNDSDENILEEFTQGWHEAMTKVEGRSIWDVLDELEDEP